jgi:hypothetical protein
MTIAREGRAHHALDANGTCGFLLWHDETLQVKVVFEYWQKFFNRMLALAITLAFSGKPTPAPPQTSIGFNASFGCISRSPITGTNHYWSA